MSAHDRASSDSAEHSLQERPIHKTAQDDRLQSLLAFAAWREQAHQSDDLRTRQTEPGRGAFDEAAGDREQFVLDEVLQLVADRAVAITGADGVAIALAENDKVVLRAAVGKVCPDLGAGIDRDSGFSGACLSMVQVMRCDDSETDARVDLQACRRLGARSMIAVPLSGRQHGIGLLEAFSAEPGGFNDSDAQSLSLLAELLLRALKPEDEDRISQSVESAAAMGAEPILAQEVAITKGIPSEVACLEAAQTASVTARPLAGEFTAVTLHESAIDPETSFSDFKSSVVATAESKVIARKSIIKRQNDGTHSSGSLLVWACLVIAVGFVGGIWWGLKTGPQPSVAARVEKIASKPLQAAAKSLVTVLSPRAGTVVAGANINPHTTFGHEPAASSPVSTQSISKFPRVTGIRHWASADSSTVEVDLENAVRYNAHCLPGPDRFYFDLYDTQLASDLAGRSINVADRLLNRIRAAQPVAGTTRIVLETKANSDFAVSLQPNPYRLVIEVRKLGQNPKGGVGCAP